MQTYHIVSITSQGQMTIPVKIRKALKLDKSSQVQVHLEGDTMHLEPVMDFMSLKGIHKDRAIKGKPIQEVIRMEKEAVAEAVAERYLRKLKRMNS